MKSEEGKNDTHIDAKSVEQNNGAFVTWSWQKNAEQKVALADSHNTNAIYKISQTSSASSSHVPANTHAQQDRRVTLDLGQVLNLSSAKGPISLKILVKHPAKGTLLNVEKLPPGVDVEYDAKMGAIILYGKAEDIAVAIKQIELGLFSAQQSTDLIIFIKVNTELNEAAVHLHASEDSQGTINFRVFHSSGDSFIQEEGQKLFVDSRPIEELYFREKHDESGSKEIFSFDFKHDGGESGAPTVRDQTIFGSLPLPPGGIVDPTPSPPSGPDIPPITPPSTPEPPANHGGGGGGTTTPPPPASSIPVITALDAAVTVNENDVPVRLDANMTLSDAATLDYNGGNITITSTGLAEDQLSLASDAIGIGALQLNGNNVEYSLDGIAWTVVGTITSNGVNGAGLVVSLNVNATPAIAEAIIEHVTYQNTSDNPAATHPLTVRVDNGDTGGVSTTETITVTVTPSNDAPVLAGAISDQAALAGGAFSFTFAAGAFTDVDSTLSYTATLANGSPLPGWLTFDDTTRTFSGTPAFSDLGTISVKVVASDGTATIDDTFDIVISNNLAVSNLNQTDTYVEDTTKDLGNIVVASPAATITATLTLGNPALGTLTTGSSGAVTSAYDAMTGIWTASGALADVNALLAGVQFVPVANSIASASISISITDSVDTSTGTITLSATSVNDAPVATADSYSTNEDTPLTVNAASGVLANDTDPNDSPSNALSVTLVSNVSHGSLILSADGSFTYTPTQDYVGSDSFTYRIDDNGGTANGGVSQGNTVTVNLTIGGVDDAPINTVPGAQTTNEDTSAVISGISVADADDATVTVTLSVTHGTLSVNNAVAGGLTAGQISSNGSSSVTLTGTTTAINATLADSTGLTFTPTTNYNGSATLTVLTDDGVLTDSDTVAITINSVNDAPAAAADSYTTTEDTPLTVNAASGVLANDTDPNDSPANALNATLISNAGHGSVTLNSDGSFTYTPNADYAGSDSFTYRVDDNGGTANGGNDHGNTVTVSLTVTGTNDAPVNTVPAAQTTNEDTAKVISGVSVSDVDSSPLTVTLSVTHGTLSINASVGGGLTAGQITGNGTASITLTGTAAAINATLADSVGLTFTPTANYNGSANLTILTSDGSLTDSDTVAITINSVNDAPTATADSYSASEDTPLTINAASGVLANDTDPNDSPANALSATLISTVSHGSLTLNADGSFTYTPTADYAGSDSFTYRVDDNGGNANGGTNQGNTVTVSLTVSGTNDAPVNTVPSAQTTNEDTAKVISGVSVSDVDSSPLTVTLSVTHGTLSINASVGGGLTAGQITGNGTASITLMGTAAAINTTLADVAGLSFTPTANYNGSANLTVLTSDGALSDSDSVGITINSVNDAPTATADSYSTNEDTPLTVNAAAGVLANDADPNDSPANALSATLISTVSHGSLTLNADGSFTYTPTADYAGSDSFTYRVDDNGGTANGGNDHGNTVTVSLTVTGTNDAPVNTVPTAQTTNEDTAKIISGVSVADVDNASVTVTLTVTHGVLNINTAVAGGLTAGQITTNGTASVVLTGTATAINATLADAAGLTFTPTANYNGSANLTVLTSDGSLSDSDSVGITINSVNDAPTATADSYSTNEDTPLTVNAASGVLANDSDPNDSPTNTLNATLIGNVSHGSLTLNSDGSFTYTPTANYNGSDSFTYRVDDNGGTANGGTNQGNTVTVSLTVNSVNDAPVNTVPGTQTLNEDSSKVISGISVADVDNASVTVTLSVAHGTLTINNAVAGGLTAGQISTNGTASVVLTGTTAAINATLANATGLTYVPTADYTGSDSLTVLTSDGTLSDSDSVTLSVTSVSDAPIFSGLSTTVTYLENTVNATPQVLDSSVIFSDVDPESYAGGSLSIVLSSGGVEDQLSIRNQGVAAGQIGVSGTNVTYGGVVVGVITSTGVDGDDLSVSFNSNSTPAAVKALVENVTYLNTSDTPAAARSAMFTISDGTNSVSQTIAINVTQEVDTFNLTSGSDHFLGGTENDTFQGSGANLSQLDDTLMGGAGADVLSITGGTAVFDTTTFTDLGGIEEFIFNNNAAHDITVADAYFSTTGFNGTTLKMTANATAAIGVNFDASAVAASHIVSLTGGNGDDTLLGGAGADSIYSNGGDDSIDGGAGDDTVTAAISNINPNDTISGAAGTGDWLILTGGAINLNTTTFSNIGGFERFGYNAENNHSLTLADAYYGTAGFSGNIVYLTTTAVTGNITLDASGVTTSTNKVNATGSGGNDTLIGGAGNDTLSAGNGTNRLVGGGGADSLTGGSGVDRFVYTAVSESTLANQDTITGFVSGTDFIDLSGLGLDYLHNNAFTSAPNQVRWQVSGSDVVVQIDTNGDAVADSQITVAGVASLQVTDFTGVNIVSTTFTLTSGTDNFTGGASTDQFQGAAGDLATTDSIRGGAGNDILQITSGVLTLNTATYTNLVGVEEFQLNSVGAHTLTIGNAYYSTTGFVGNNITISTTSTTGSVLNAGAVSTATKTVNITGGAGNDAITGGAGNDTLSGGAGNDTITGNAGNDSIDGGAGNDSFTYTMANLTTADTIAGGAGTDTLTITTGTMTMTTGTTYINISGVETISLTSNAAHSITLNEGYYSSIGFSGTNMSVTTTSTTGITVDGTALTSGSFTMSATGGAGNDTLTGGAGADSLTAGAGNDSMTGGAGNDRFSFITTNLNSSDTIIGGAGTADMLYISSGTFNLDPTTLTNMSGIESFYFNNAASHILTLTDSYYTSMGMSGSTVIVSTASSAVGITVNASAVTGASYILNATGSSGNDTFRGGAGNDIFNASTGNDSVDGGAGNDTINFSSANYVTSADTLGGGSGMDSLVITGGTTVFSLNTTTMLNFTGIETVTVNRNAAHTVTVDDTYFTTTGFVGNVFTFSTNSSTGSNLNASAVTNTAKSVFFTSGSGNDTIVAGAGNDTINNSTGTDNINAGAGDDVFLSSGSNYTSADTIAGGAGMDTMQTNAGTLSLNTSTFTSFSGIETFALNNNAAHSLTFYDAYYSTAGFVGNNIAITSTSTTAFTINATNVTTASHTINVTGFSAADNFTGGSGNDTLNGGSGNDTMVGGGGDDSMIGDIGNDNITGGLGYDWLSGGAGTDNYIYTLATDSGIGVGNRDIISDFATGDKISLSAFAGIFTFRAGGAGEANYTGSVSQVAYGQDGSGNTVVYVDSDGNGVTNFEIQLTGNFTLAATDFTL